MTSQTPTEHADNCLGFWKKDADKYDGHCQYFLTDQEKQEEVEGKKTIGRVHVWVHPQGTLLQNSPTPVPDKIKKN